jgi:hypothetical protein
MKQEKVLVQFSTHEEAKALPVLLRHSPGMALPERKYVISADAAQALREAGVGFTELDSCDSRQTPSGSPGW